MERSPLVLGVADSQAHRSRTHHPGPGVGVLALARYAHGRALAVVLAHHIRRWRVNYRRALHAPAGRHRADPGNFRRHPAQQTGR